MKAAKTRAQQRALILTLRMRRDPRTLDALLRHLLSTKSAHERQLASRVLGAAGAWWALEPIRQQLRDPARSVKHAARKALRLLCPRHGLRTRFELAFEPTKQSLPRSLQAGRAFQLHLSVALSSRRDVMFRWPSCAPAKGRRLWRYRVRPFLKLEKKGRLYYLKASVMLVQMPNRSVSGYARAKATFKAELNAFMLRQVLVALTASLKRQIHAYLDRRRASL